MKRNKCFLFGILAGLIFAVSINPILTKIMLTRRYENQLQEKLGDAFPDVGEETSITVNYYKRYLAYGSISNGRDKYFFILNPLDTSTYYPVKLFVD